METKFDFDKMEDSVTAGIVIGVIDILAMLAIITFLCTGNFGL